MNGSDLNTRIKKAFTEQKILISLSFDYLETVDKKCANHVLYNTHNEDIEQLWHSSDWQIWMVNNKFPNSANNAATRSLLSLFDLSPVFYKQLAAEHRVAVNCSLDMLDGTSAYSLKDFGEFAGPPDYFEKILRSTVATMGELCDTDVKLNDQQTCIKISEGVSSLSVFFCSLLFLALFTCFAPAVVCLYPATEDTHEGIRKITVEGPSPVGFRSLIGNYFFSADHTMWHMARKFIMRVFILPIPVLVPAIFVEYLLYQITLSRQTGAEGRAHLFHPFRVICYCCYCIQAFYFYFLKGKVNCTSSCVCVWDEAADLAKGEHLRFVWTCSHQELPQRMLTRFRSYWNSTVNLTVIGWPLVFYLTFLYDNIKKIKNEIFTCYQHGVISVSTVFRFLRSTVSVMIYILLYCVLLLSWVVCILVFLPFAISPIVVLCMCASSGFWQLVNLNFVSERFLVLDYPFAVVFLDIFLSCLAAIGVVSVLKFAAVGIMILLQLAATYVLSEENLPFLTCSVLVCGYLWGSYGSFTKRYQDLAVRLFEQYDKLTDSPFNTDLHMQRNRSLTQKYQELAVKLYEKYYLLKDTSNNTGLNMQGFTSDYARTIDNVKRIPKELFDMACEELMSVKTSFCIMMFKATLSVVFVLSVFLFTMSINASPVTKAFLTFVTGLCPQIVTIYVERKRNRKTKIVPINEIARKTVYEYININSPCNQVEKRHFVFPGKYELQGEYRFEPLAFLTLSVAAVNGFLIL